MSSLTNHGMCHRDVRVRELHLSMASSSSGPRLPPITLCHGRAGSVILFAGQGLHRATHSEFEQRRVVTFRFKRNLPHLARLYPMDLVRRENLGQGSLAASTLLRGATQLLGSIGLGVVVSSQVGTFGSRILGSSSRMKIAKESTLLPDCKSLCRTSKTPRQRRHQGFARSTWT